GENMEERYFKSQRMHMNPVFDVDICKALATVTVNPAIKKTLLRLSPLQCKEEVILLRANGKETSQEALSRIRSRGFGAASIIDLIALVANYPDIAFYSRVVCLGT